LVYGTSPLLFRGLTDTKVEIKVDIPPVAEKPKAKKRGKKK
jgi:hypothetical protein